MYIQLFVLSLILLADILLLLLQLSLLINTTKQVGCYGEHYYTRLTALCPGLPG